MHLQIEPVLTIRQGPVLAEFAAMVSRPGKTITEMRDLVTEMDRKLKLIRDLTHEGVSDVHARSVLIGLLDPHDEATRSLQTRVRHLSRSARRCWSSQTPRVWQGLSQSPTQCRWEALTCLETAPEVQKICQQNPVAFTQ